VGAKSRFVISREGAMHEIREHRLGQSRVTAVFEDRALSFILAKGATLEELSDRLADLGQRQERRPIAITVKFGASTHKEAVNGSRDAQVGMSTLREGQERFSASSCWQ
jgi:hypothetical protein